MQNQNETVTNFGEINKLPNLPLDVSTELAQYSTIYVCKRHNPFRNFCCFLPPIDYEILGELPDKDKKILFTSQIHFNGCCNCCSNCTLDCLLCEYVCCDSILFQMDYKRNNNTFYTQGFNVKSGCYCIECHCCYYCCNRPVLYLRENIDPDNPDINCGINKGKTLGTNGCCSICKDKVVSYINELEQKGPNLRYKVTCCDICNTLCCGYCSLCANDLHIDIFDGNEQRVGDIFVSKGCSSSAVDKTCFCPGSHYEIHLPQNSSSIEKFQIIADVIHFDLENKVI